MASAGLEILGLALSVVGTLLEMVACGLPTWKVTAFIEANIVVAQTIWDGLWMSCAVQSTGQMQCKVHDSVLALTPDLQAARALTVISSVMGIVGLMVVVAGAQCTNCIRADAVKARVVNAGGAIYIVSGVFVLVPLCWMANNIITEFYDPLVPASMKREIGAALYIGWAATGLLLVGGAILCCSCPSAARSGYSVKYAHGGGGGGVGGAQASTNGGYDKRNYV
ncbi:claudin 5a [Denticeps clupeoides]|uniref:Claudin n=1 Tax=Denticeps clupeoides TaxID=299321 RepID=A0A8C4BSQ5_9TELE|nr:claudin-4-like [Denticeps clupeoides]XP_028851396.1 claudin-4-like [Denticeps clupeoides]